ncbi:MAG TPA: hypothetical protein VK422_23030 [Pyrinomonadaceae bacterium]|nr:hypothetical protein [Pyrinomonadaceae bacterium]
MLNWIFENVNGRTALVAFVVLSASTVALGLANPKNEIIGKLCGDYVSTDSSFYSIDKAAHMFGRYGEDASLLAAHKTFLRLHDRIYPLCYALPLVLLLAYFYPVPEQGGSRRFGWVVLLPLLAMAFDYAENQTILSVLEAVGKKEPAPPSLLKVARVFTALKLSLLLVSLLLLLGFVGSAQARLRELLSR